ncbi:MAG: hypothetical protein HY557_04395 [Euryarchaeota archaeon]|nr:hypothetical protein [Euryarchaeota archaeon]
MAKFVRYGPSDRYGMPEAGFCASSFAIVRAGRKVLLGVARPHPRWEAEWAPNFSVYTPEDLAAEFRDWRFPAAYLYEGESPDDCLGRVMRDMLRVARWTVTGQKTHAFYDPSTWYPGRMHYDLCFVYDVKLAKAPAVPPWFARLEYVDPKTLRGDDFGSAMGDLAKALRLIQKK